MGCFSSVEEAPSKNIAKKDDRWTDTYIPHVPDEEQAEVIEAIHAYETHYCHLAERLRKETPSKDWPTPFRWEMTQVNTVLKIPAGVLHVHFNVHVDTNFTYTAKGERSHHGDNGVCMMSRKDSGISEASNSKRTWKAPDEIVLCMQRMKELKMRAKESGEDIKDVKVQSFKKDRKKVAGRSHSYTVDSAASGLPEHKVGLNMVRNASAGESGLGLEDLGEVSVEFASKDEGLQRRKVSLRDAHQLSF